MYLIPLLIMYVLTCGIILSIMVMPRGLLTLENPNLLNVPGSEPRLSVSDMEWSLSEKPGGGAR